MSHPDDYSDVHETFSCCMIMKCIANDNKIDVALVGLTPTGIVEEHAYFKAPNADLGNFLSYPFPF